MKMTMIAIHENTHEPFNVCGIFIGNYWPHFADNFGSYAGGPEEDNLVSPELQAVMRMDMARQFPGSVVVFREVDADKFHETCKAYNETASALAQDDTDPPLTEGERADQAERDLIHANKINSILSAQLQECSHNLDAANSLISSLATVLAALVAPNGSIINYRYYEPEAQAAVAALADITRWDDAE